MLDVAYEAVDDLPPGRLARIDEDRGRIRVRLDRSAPLPDVVRQLNIEIADLMASARWFQLWDDEIVSHNTPGRPLRIEYVLDRKEDDGAILAELKGLLRVYIDPALNTAGFAASMNPVTRQHLDAGHWFQLYAGEIIDNSPEPMRHL
ncbi:hypothetical protein [Streptomyces sp. NPDC060027]|uniref:hypothetical protein n=1 Tax=Streptomyces sp. NPDC060027 TaxID=3347040 RepID=UPI0036968B13